MHRKVPCPGTIVGAGGGTKTIKAAPTHSQVQGNKGKQYEAGKVAVRLQERLTVVFELDTYLRICRVLT